MTITANAYEVAVLIIAIAFLIIVIAAIPAILQFKRTIKALEDLSAESRRTVEILNIVLKKAGDEIGDVEELVKKVKEVGLKITGITEMFIENIKSPVITFLSLLLGFEFGLKRFFKKDKKEEDN